MKTFSNLPIRLPRLLLGAGLLFSATAAYADTDTWLTTGTVEYANPNNWSLGRVPTSTDDVTIPSGGTQPTINQLGTARNLTINTGASLTIGPLGNLDLFGNLVDNGVINGGSVTNTGSISTRSATLQTFSGTSTLPIAVNDLMVMSTSTSGGVLLQMPVTLGRQLYLISSVTTTTTGTLLLLSTPTITAFVVNAGGVVNNAVGGTASNGTVTMQRAIDNSFNTGVGYRHYSSPVSNTTVADLFTATYTPNFTGAPTYNTSAYPPATTPFPTIYTYDQAFVARTNSSPNFDKGWIAATSAANPLVPGRGITVNLDGSQLEDFVGALNNGPITVSMARNASGTLNDASAGYQFLGNPYPAPIDFRLITNAQRGAVGSGASPIYNTLYVYHSTSQYGGVYRTYSGTTGIGNPIIPSSQAFMVRMTTPGTTATFTFDNSQRLTTSDNTTFQRPVADTRPQLELTLGNKVAPELDFFNLIFQPGSTTGNNDQYDALKIPNQNGMSVNSTTPNGDALAIDGRPAPTDEMTIPLQLKVAEDGTYTLNASKLDNFKGMYVYLRDKQKSTLTDLSQQASYTFTTSSANTNARFDLVVSPRPVENAPAAIAQQVALYPNPAKGSASLELPTSIGNEDVSASLIDAMGRTVRTIELPAQGSVAHQLDLRGLAAGVYALRLRTSAGTVVNRLTVE